MASSLNLPPPPIDTAPFNDGKQQLFTLPWQRWFLILQHTFLIAVAPGDAAFIVAQSNAALSNATNLGALAAGYLRTTVIGSVATVLSDVVLCDALEPTQDVDIRANCSAIVADRFVVALGHTLTVESGAVFQVT